MSNKLDLARVFAQDAALLRLARERANIAHPTDLRAAGNEVEDSVRCYFRRILPTRYYVTSGHLIDPHHKVSPQIDIIIADGLSLPSLYTTSDGTEYIPITSVFAIGEVKSTYHKSGAYFQKLERDLAQVADMDRPLVKNTLVKGQITDETILLDMMQPINSNRYLNHLLSFLFCVDTGDFALEDVAKHLNATDPARVPNVTVLLNKGVLVRMQMTEVGEGKYHKYPTEAPSPTYDWAFAESMDEGGGTKEGSNLAFLYGALIDHLRNSRLEPTNAYQYTSGLVNLRRSTLKWAKGRPPEPTP